MRLVWAFAGMLLLAAGDLHAGPVSASEITTRGRPIEKILESALFPEGNPKRSVLFVVDPSRTLRTAGFGKKLYLLLRKRTADTGDLRLGIVNLGAENGEDPLPLGSDQVTVSRRAVDATSMPRNVLRDVYRPLKRCIPMFAREPEHRTIVLLTHQNGDTEYKLESVIAALKSAKIRVVVITREVLLSDSYWFDWSSRSAKPPKRAYLASSEAAFVEIPYGWLHQTNALNGTIGSGFGMWGLSRLAAATGGRVEILYTSEAARHRCADGWTCTFCRGFLHDPPNRSLLALRMQAVEPSLESRRTVYKQAASDPYYKGVLKAWSAGHKAGIVDRRPTVRRSGGRLGSSLDRENLDDSYSFLYVPLSNWRRAAKEAKARAKAANRIATSLRKAIAAGDRAGASARYRAIAELTYVMVRLTRLNDLYLEAFLRDVAPRIAPPRAKTPASPEVPMLSPDREYSSFGLGWSCMSLCHGVRPFLDLRLPGGNALDVELRAFAVDYDTFLKRNAHTQYLAALSNMGIARYSLTGFGKGNVKGSTGPARQSPRTGRKKDTRTKREKDPERGERSGGSSSGGSDNPTSGG